MVKRFEDFLRGRHDLKPGTKVVYVGAVNAFNKVLAESARALYCIINKSYLGMCA